MCTIYLVQMKLLVCQKHIWFKKNLDRTVLGSEKTGQMMPGPKALGQLWPVKWWSQSKQISVQKSLGQTKFSSRNFGSKKIKACRKLGRNWLSNCWDIPDMDKCQQNKWYLDKCHHNSWNLLKMVPEIALKFGQNRSNSLDVANLEFVWVVVVKTNFHVKPNLGFVKLSLGFDNIYT